MATWATNDNVNSALWERFGQELPSIANRLSNDRYRVSFFPAGQEREWTFHLIGAAVASLDRIPPLLVGKTLPALTCARFVHKGRSADLSMTLDYIYQTWLPKSGKAIAAPLEIELCSERYLGPNHPQSESQILIPIE
jgi:AraC family transcriptional regulator